MYLFIDTLSVRTCLILFGEERNIIDKDERDFYRKEFEMLPGAIDELLRKHEINYSDLQGIVVVNGPWGFTGTRVTCLVANSIAFAHTTPLYPVSYFELLKLSQAPYPHAIQANKREVMVQQTTSSAPSIIPFVEIEPIQYYGTWDVIAFWDNGATLWVDIDYKKVARDMPLSRSTNRISPRYIKDPNITLRPS